MTSQAQVTPRTASAAAATVARRKRWPTTTAISPSNSTRSLSGGSTTGARGPTTDDGAFRKRSGSDGHRIAQLGGVIAVVAAEADDLAGDHRGEEGGGGEVHRPAVVPAAGTGQKGVGVEDPDLAVGVGGGVEALRGDPIEEHARASGNPVELPAPRRSEVWAPAGSDAV